MNVSGLLLACVWNYLGIGAISACRRLGWEQVCLRYVTILFFVLGYWNVILIHAYISGIVFCGDIRPGNRGIRTLLDLLR